MQRYPRGILAGWRQLAGYSHLLRNLVARDLKLKYKGSVFGFLWSLANPLLMLAVYTLAFRYIIRVQVENFPLFFIVGYLPFVFLSGALTLGATCLVDNASLIDKIYFPRQAIPYSVALSAAIQFVLALVCLAPVFWLAGMAIGPGLLALPLLVALQLMFTIGMVLIVAVLHTRFRDTKHFLEIGLVVWFWVTPIVYPLTMAPDNIRSFIRLNPMTGFIVAYRMVLLDGSLPSPAILGELALISAIGLVLGTLMFRTVSPQISEML